MIGQHIADGLLSGAIVSLGAIGLTLTMRILKFANFSHSELLTWGAYMALVFAGWFAAMGDFLGGNFGSLTFGWGFIVAVILSGAATVALALVLDFLVYGRMRGRAAPMTLVFASFGVALIVRNVLVLMFGDNPHYYSRELQMAVLLPGDILVQPNQIFVLGLTIVLVIALHLFLTRSRTGIAMRATAENTALAQVSGVNVEGIVRWTWIIGGGLAAIAGTLYGLTVQIRPELGFSLILPLFAAAILGGTGSVYGAVIGGLVVGLAENLSVMWIPTGYKPAIPFLLIMAILYVRPQGLFGEEQ